MIEQQHSAAPSGNFGRAPFLALAVASRVPFGSPNDNVVAQARVGHATHIRSVPGPVRWARAIATSALGTSQAPNACGQGIAPVARAWLARLLSIAGLHAGLVFALRSGGIAICRRPNGAVLRTRLTIGAALALASTL